MDAESMWNSLKKWLVLERTRVSEAGCNSDTEKDYRMTQENTIVVVQDIMRQIEERGS